MSINTDLEIHRKADVTRVLDPVELNARRVRKAFTEPLDPPHQSLEPARNSRRSVVYPANHGQPCIQR